VTERLYYQNSYATEFEAEIIRVEKHGARSAVVLDRTAFYPTSGGQPFDTGRLGDANVIEVVDADAGSILHVVDRELAKGPVHGSIDWSRRLEHMQQHTGQHVLSAAFDRLSNARTESFHLGSASSTIDLNRALSAAEIEQVENEANRVVWDDRPVTIRFADAAEAAQLPLRKDSAREGTLRLIEVADFDISACGGTHVARTGAIGMIAVASTERFRGGTRVEFLCGVRALRGYRALRDVVSGSVRLVSVLPAELPAGIERLQAESKAAKKQLKELQVRLSTFEAASLAQRAEAHATVQVVLAALEGWDQAGLKAIASELAGRPGHAAVLFSVPPPSAVVIARAPDAAVDCAAVLKQLVERFGGKGGGRPDLAQGGGLEAPADELLSFARGLL
jgi:alanyl-tRNA synthetase